MLHKIPRWFQKLFPGYVWQINKPEKHIYLSFDDGPVPEVTDWVLEQLHTYQAKASFFMVGQNIQRNPQVFSRVKAAGHTLGNHTHQHVKGWGTATAPYLANVAACSRVMQNVGGEKPALFRPPYGRIFPAQARELRKHYDIVMWSVLSADYNARLAPEICLQNTIKATHPGAIVVFHDSQKAKKNLEYVLPRYLAHFSNLGYTFKAL